MRLLNVKSLELAWFRNDNRPKYVVASHRWVEEHETTFKNVRKRRKTDDIGFEKVRAFAKFVKDNASPVEWLWIDTCCINQEDAAELSEAVNLMFEWYRDAEMCIAYLADVTVTDEGSFGQSEWFQRGWTLQELLAPRVVVFVTEDWQVIGNKGGAIHPCCTSDKGPGLEGSISRITGIPEQVLQDYKTSADVSDEARMRWMDGRRTSREEDMSYALYGIFGVSPGANYGERYDGARQRLLGAIRQRQNLASQEAERFRKISAWLSPPDPWTNHNSARQRHEPYTGTWLLESAQYQSWKSGTIQHLWVYGKAGCGKTVLCSTAIEDIRRHCNCKSAANAGHAIFYFSFSDNHKQSYDNLVRSLVVQLGWKEPGVSMLQRAYDEPNRNLPSSDELEKIVLSSVESYDEVFLLLDALDECPESSEVRTDVLEYLERLARSAPKLRILATSREVADVRESIEMLGGVSIATETQSVDADIRKYVTSQLSCDKKLRRLDSATSALIEETISRKADGMFRWAYCQLQELRTLPSMKPKYVRETLRSLPLTLDGTYERMLKEIKQLFRPEALVLLRWVAYAQSPPSLGELAEAVIVDPEGEGSVEVEERGGLEDTLEILSGLVSVQGVDTDDHSGEEKEGGGGGGGGGGQSEDMASDDEDNDSSVTYRHRRVEKDARIQLAHFSVKEYLESTRILDGEAREFHLESAVAHRFLAQSCLTYLLHYATSSEKSSTRQDLVIFPLLQYAARSWAYHSSLQQAGPVTRETFLLTSDEAISDWLLVHRPDSFPSEPFESRRRTGTGLYYASYMGLGAVVNDLLAIGSDIDAQGEVYGNALQAASARGYREVVRLLLDRGADVNAQGGFYDNALLAASAGGYREVVRLLLDRGADVNAPGQFCGNALQAASFEGADVNAPGQFYGNALQAASFEGHQEVVQLLLDRGAGVNAQGGYYDNALQAASTAGHREVVQLLLDRGADVNAQGGIYGNALQAASLRGHREVAQLLLDRGADVNAQEGIYDNALQAASAGGHREVVRLLLDRGVDIDAQGDIYSNALQAASARGHREVVQLLLDRGADVNLPVN